jgi:hypothetical protein
MSRWIRSAAMIGRVSRHQFMNNPKLQSSTSISLPLPTPTRLEYLGSAVQSCPPRACGHLNRDDLVYETLRKCGAHSLAHASPGLLPLRRIVSWLGQRRRSRRRNSNPQAIVHRHAWSRPWKWHRLGQHNRLGKLWIKIRRKPLWTCETKPAYPITTKQKLVQAKYFILIINKFTQEIFQQASWAWAACKQGRLLAQINKSGTIPRVQRVQQRAPPRGWLAPGTGSGNSSEPRVASWSLITLHHHHHYSTTDGYVYDRRPPHYDHASASPPPLQLQGLQPQPRQGRWFANPHPSAHEEFSAFCGLVSSRLRVGTKPGGMVGGASWRAWKKALESRLPLPPNRRVCIAARPPATASD